MTSGDMLVQGIGIDRVVPDIRYNVPCGNPTVIPGNKACDSRDLGRMISAGQIRDLGVQLDNNPRLNNRVLHQPKPVQADPVMPPLPPMEVSGETLELRAQLQRLQVDLNLANAENQRLSVALEESRTECGKLLADGGKLRAELARLQTEDSKLSTILGKLDNLPTQVVVQAGGSKEETRKSATDESDVPDYIPTFHAPVASNMGKPKANVVESTGETPGDALRKFRKGKSS